MAEKKLDISYICGDTVRIATLEHRKKELMEKLDELKLLCDVDACAVIYNPMDPNPEVWPSNLEVTNVIEKFEMLKDERKKKYKSVNDEEVLSEKMKKKREKLIEEKQEKYMKEVMLRWLNGNMSMDDYRPELCDFIDQYLKKLIHHKNVTLKNPHFQIGESSSIAVSEEGLALASTKEVYIPVMSEDDSNEYQNQQEGFVEEMMKLGEQTGFPWMEDNHNF